eukprot:scaffold8008_cov122-Isochrysis_galbana.AAC.1
MKLACCLSSTCPCVCAVPAVPPQLIADKDAKTLTLIDRGCGMTKEDLINHLGAWRPNGRSALLGGRRDVGRVGLGGAV